MESIKKWRSYLIGRHFKLVTDQRSVAFMLNNKHVSKIKNEKIQRWRIELSCFSYDIVYRAGSMNDAPDALSRIACLQSSSKDELKRLHEALCHPGVTRMNHFVKSKNMPYSLAEIKILISNCNTCSKLKPNFFKPRQTTLVKATQPFERLNLDFKGPVPSTSNNKYILNVIDEYSRFPFSFPCSDISTKTVIKCLVQLFALFGLPSYIHSDRGASFMSSEFRNFLHMKGVATSRTTAYNPTGNSQVERYNGIIWKSITLALESKGLQISQWELVLPDVLHSIRSLLSTSTNETPHERFLKFSRRSTSGQSLPNWLMEPGNVLMKRHARNSKYEPLVSEVELLQSNIDYAHVRLPDGRETTVSTKHLAPCGQNLDKTDEKFNPVEPDPNQTIKEENPSTVIDCVNSDDGENNEKFDDGKEKKTTEVRRSTRIKKTPNRLTYH